MPKQGKSARIILCGLDRALADELGAVLAQQDQEVHTEPYRSPAECLAAVQRLRADLIFISSERDRYLGLLEAVSRHKPDLPVVVVSRRPEVSEWLDAIEAGAADYCAAPFESSHIQWILDSTLNRQAAPALYRTAG